MLGGAIRGDRRPLYEQAQAAIIKWIADGTLLPGAQLPSEDHLAVSLGVSRTTIRGALGNLETLGYIERVHGAGTFVAQRHFKVEAQLEELESFHPRLAARAGLASSISHLTIDEMPADATAAAALHVTQGSPVIRIARVVAFGGTPVVQLEDFLPADRFSVAELRANFRDSTVDYFDGCNGRPVAEWSDSILEAESAGERQAGLLKVARGSTLLRLDEGFYGADGTLLSWSHIYIVPDFFRFRMRRHIVHEADSSTHTYDEAREAVRGMGLSAL